jgi:hypothetical protein
VSREFRFGAMSIQRTVEKKAGRDNLARPFDSVACAD